MIDSSQSKRLSKNDITYKGVGILFWDIWVCLNLFILIQLLEIRYENEAPWLRVVKYIVIIIILLNFLITKNGLIIFIVFALPFMFIEWVFFGQHSTSGMLSMFVVMCLFAFIVPILNIILFLVFLI